MPKLIFLILSFFMAAKAADTKADSVPGEYVVKFRTANKSTFLSMSDQLKGLKGIELKSTLSSLGISIVKIDDSKSSLERLMANPNVEMAEPNYIYSVKYILGAKPNDAAIGKLWGLINTGQPDSNGQVGTPGVDINAINAWKIQRGSSDTIVAVIDSGVNYKTKDIAANMWVNEPEKNGKKGVDDDGNGYVDDIYGYNFVNDNGDPMDDEGHGTHCSGTIGAIGDDGFGIVGVAWKTKIMALKFLNDKGRGNLADALRAVDYAIKMGAKVISNSWSGAGYSEMLKQAIQRSNDAGMIFVAAAGNEGNDNGLNPKYPANYDVPNVISVAAIDNRGKLAEFSNFGKAIVHIAAPGVNIYSTVLKGYDSWSGTSMATPHVSGAAVLIASQYPQMSGVQIKEAILNAAVPKKNLRSKVSTGGHLDVYGALMLKKVGPDPEDPANWPNKMAFQLSSDHPYRAQLKNSWEVTVPNANEVSVYFPKLDLEYKYDTIKLYDSNGTMVQTLSGENNDTYSEIIKGSYVKIVLETDKSVQKYGFDIANISYR